MFELNLKQRVSLSEDTCFGLILNTHKKNPKLKSGIFFKGKAYGNALISTGEIAPSTSISVV